MLDCFTLKPFHVVSSLHLTCSSRDSVFIGSVKSCYTTFDMWQPQQWQHTASYNTGIIQQWHHTIQIMSYFHPRLQLLEVHVGIPHPSALPPSAARSSSKSNPINEFTFSQRRSNLVWERFGVFGGLDPLILVLPAPWLHFCACAV